MSREMDKFIDILLNHPNSELKCYNKVVTEVANKI